MDEERIKLIDELMEKCFEKEIEELGLENWDVSNGGTFYRMFKICPWISDLSPLANWDMSMTTDMAKAGDIE